MEHHPIENIMQTTMEQLKGIIDVNTIIGNPVHTAGGAVIVPVSKVSFGFASGGGEYGTAGQKACGRQDAEPQQNKMPFAGGSGAGVSLNPVAFLVLHNHCVKLLPVNESSLAERLVQCVPELLEQIKGMLCKGNSSADSLPLQDSVSDSDGN